MARSTGNFNIRLAWLLSNIWQADQFLTFFGFQNLFLPSFWSFSLCLCLLCDLPASGHLLNVDTSHLGIWPHPLLNLNTICVSLVSSTPVDLIVVYVLMAPKLVFLASLLYALSVCPPMRNCQLNITEVPYTQQIHSWIHDLPQTTCPQIQLYW